MKDHSLLIYDGECGFCKRCIVRWRSWTKGTIDDAPSQKVVEHFSHIPKETFSHSLVYTRGETEWMQGTEAIVESLADSGAARWPLWLYRHLPGVRCMSEKAYQWVAGHRKTASRIDRALWGESLEPSTYYLSTWLFLRLLALVYFIAFLSLSGQVEGLMGETGILPLRQFLDYIFQAAGSKSYFLVPTLFWVTQSDTALMVGCIGGAVFSFLALIGVAQSLCFFCCWALYLSYVNGGRDFLSFQWDMLLLEAGFLALFLVPMKSVWGLTRAEKPFFLARWMLYWLLFRLLFSSGLVKLLSGDPAWRDATALTYHYWTQPLPTSLSWYAAQLPLWIQKLSVFCVWGAELIAPFLLFTPQRIRIGAFWPIVTLMIFITLTGNYAFFNGLTIALSLLLLDDRRIGRFFPRKLCGWLLSQENFKPPHRAFLFRRILFFFLFVLTLVSFVNTFKREPLPSWLAKGVAPVQNFRFANSYGLFAVVTKVRTEILLEGSEDGKLWRRYEFKWKPGDLLRAPPWVAPHQPRLDWQMWFASFSDYRNQMWFLAFVEALLENRPHVLELLENNPFPEKGPQHIRAIAYDYTFTSKKQRKETQQWWKRTLRGLYLAPVSLKY